MQLKYRIRPTGCYRNSQLRAFYQELLGFTPRNFKKRPPVVVITAKYTVKYRLKESV